MSCPSFEAIVDWTAGEPGEVLEEHVFSCDACARRADGLLALIEAVRDVTGEGGVQMSLLPALVHAMRTRGATVQEFTLGPEPLPCEAAHDQGVIVLRLPVSARGIESLDLTMLGPGDMVLGSVADLAFAPSGDAVLLGQPAAEWRRLPPMTITFRLSGRIGDRVISITDYVLAHGD